VHPIELAIAVQIELGFDPKIVTDPVVRIFQFFDDLRFAILDDWYLDLTPLDRLDREKEDG